MAEKDLQSADYGLSQPPTVEGHPTLEFIIDARTCVECLKRVEAQLENRLGFLPE